MDNNNTFTKFQRIVGVYLAVPLVILGVVSNVVCIVILARDKTMKCTTRFLLQMLAVADIVYLVTSVTSDVLPAMTESTDWLPISFDDSYLFYDITYYMLLVKHVTMTAATWTVVAATVDHYLSVCKPHSSARHSTMCRVVSAVCLIWTASIVFLLPKFTTWNSTVYIIIYYMICYPCLLAIVPFSILVFCLRRLIRRSRRRVPDGRSSSSASICYDERRVTFVVTIIVIVFLICRSIDTISYIYNLPFRLELNWTGREETENLIYQYLITVNNCLLCVNSVTRFYDYVLFRRYRTGTQL
jgi:hypothetical protein